MSLPVPRPSVPHQPSVTAALCQHLPPALSPRATLCCPCWPRGQSPARSVRAGVKGCAGGSGSPSGSEPAPGGGGRGQHPAVPPQRRWDSDAAQGYPGEEATPLPLLPQHPGQELNSFHDKNKTSLLPARAAAAPGDPPARGRAIAPRTNPEGPRPCLDPTAPGLYGNFLSGKNPLFSLWIPPRAALRALLLFWKTRALPEDALRTAGVTSELCTARGGTSCPHPCWCLVPECH